MPLIWLGTIDRPLRTLPTDHQIAIRQLGNGLAADELDVGDS